LSLKFILVFWKAGLWPKELDAFQITDEYKQETGYYRPITLSFGLLPLASKKKEREASGESKGVIGYRLAKGIKELFARRSSNQYVSSFLSSTAGCLTRKKGKTTCRG
jgi:hypothetical protein